jgi:outer membrane biosynthesis protein TonB
MVAFKPLVVSAAVLATPISAIFADHVSLVARQTTGGLLGGLSNLVAPSPLLGPLLAGTPIAAPAAVKPASAPVYPAPAPAVKPASAPVYPAPAPAVKPASAPVYPAPAPAPAPVPVRPAPAPAPAPVYAPAPAQGLQISASLQIVATIQFFSTRSASINQLASALVTADVSLYVQGQGNLSVFTSHIPRRLELTCE